MMANCLQRSSHQGLIRGNTKHIFLVFLANGQSEGQGKEIHPAKVRAHFNLAAGLHISYNIVGSLGSWPGRAALDLL